MVEFHGQHDDVRATSEVHFTDVIFNNIFIGYLLGMMFIIIIKCISRGSPSMTG